MNKKEELISALEIAEINFLMSFREVKPELVTKQIQKDTNHLAWIIGHCISHFDLFLSMYTDERFLTEEEREYYAYGASKEKIIEYPFSFIDLIDAHLKITQKFFNVLEGQDVKKFDEIPHEESAERLADLLKRITLHIMGHTGQIVLLRRMFDNPFWEFVGGVSKEQRIKLRNEWIKWWEENKSSYQ